MTTLSQETFPDLSERHCVELSCWARLERPPSEMERVRRGAGRRGKKEITSSAKYPMKQGSVHCQVSLRVIDNDILFFLGMHALKTSMPKGTGNTGVTKLLRVAGELAGVS